MISIQKTPDELKTISKLWRREVLKKLSNVRKKLKKESSNSNPDYARLFTYLYKAFPDIITANPKNYHRIIHKVEHIYKLNTLFPLYVRGKKPTKLQAEKYNTIRELLNKTFLFKDTSDEIFYWLADHLQSNVCLYCNRQYTITYKDKNLRPEFDHFYTKSKYPYLAFSFYNLIPSCTSCNGSVKQITSFSYPKHFHPYLDSCVSDFNFMIHITKADDLLNGRGYRFELLQRTLPKSSAFRKLEENEKTFGLMKVYSNHSDIVQETINKALLCNYTIINNLTLGINKSTQCLPSNSEYHFSEKRALALYFGLNELRSDVGKRPFSKLLRDVIETYLDRQLRVYLDSD